MSIYKKHLEKLQTLSLDNPSVILEAEKRRQVYVNVSYFRKICPFKLEVRKVKETENQFRVSIVGDGS